MKKIGIIAIVAVIFGCLVGCGALVSVYNQMENQGTSESSQTGNSSSGSSESSSSGNSSSGSASSDESESVEIDPTEAISVLSIDEMFTNNELTLTYTEDEATVITLSNESVTIEEEGTYIVSGTLEDGQIIIDVEDTEKVHLILDGVDISCSSSAAIYVLSADKVFVTLPEGSENALSVTGEFDSTDENGVDGVIFSKSDISFLGTGSLEINTEYGHGIVAKDDLVFMSGVYNITVSDHGIKANDSIRIADGTFTIISGEDGIKADNDEDADKGYIYIANGTFDIEAQEDGISASSMLQIDDGTFNVVGGGGYVEVLNDITMGEGSGNMTQATDSLESSMKGMKACNIEINGGDIYISAYEDALKADYDMVINGGSIYILSGDDAVHAENELTINDVELVVEASYEGIEACYIYINGGTMIVVAYDDAMNATEDYGLIHITDGQIYLNCVGDGIDSNGDLTIEGGYIIIECNPIYSGGDGEVDVTGDVTYTGGTIVDEEGNEIDPTAGMSSGMTGPGSSIQQMTPGRK